MSYIRIAFDMCDQRNYDNHPVCVALSNAILSVSGGDQTTSGTQCFSVTLLTDPSMQFAFDGCDHNNSDVPKRSVALSNAIHSVGGGDHIRDDIRIEIVTPLTDPLIPFAFDSCDHSWGVIHRSNVALSNAISSVSGGDQATSGTQCFSVTTLTDPYLQFAFDGCDQTVFDTHSSAVAPSNAIPSVGGGDQQQYDIQCSVVTPLTDPHKFAFDCDRTNGDTQTAHVALSNAMASVSDGDQVANDIHYWNVTSLTDPLIKFAFDGCDQFDRDTQRGVVALSNAISSVSGGDHYYGDIHFVTVTPLTDPFRSDDRDRVTSANHNVTVASSNSVSDGDHIEGAIHLWIVASLTDPFAFDGCDQGRRGIPYSFVALSNAINSVSDSDQVRRDLQKRIVASLTDPLAFGDDDHGFVVNRNEYVTLPDASTSVGGGDHPSHGTHSKVVTPPTDPLYSMAATTGGLIPILSMSHHRIRPVTVTRSRVKTKINLSILLTDPSSVSGGDQFSSDTHSGDVTPLTDPIRKGNPHVG
jgi:hypothetical protein